MSDKTITTRLIYGDPLHSSVYSLSDSNMQMIFINKDDYDFIRTEHILQQEGVYILFSGEYMGNRRKLYIGQSANVSNRLLQHSSKKDFWTSALVFIRKNRYNRTEIQYLEYYMIKSAIECGQSELLENCQIPTEPYIVDVDRTFLECDFNDMKLLLKFAGYHIFDNRQLEIGNVQKKQSHKIINRIVQAYQKSSDNVSLEEPEYDTEEKIVTYILKDEDCYAEASIMKDGKIMVLPFGYIKLSLNPDTVAEQFKTKIDSDTRKLMTTTIVDNLSQAAELITGQANDSLWRKKITFV